METIETPQKFQYRGSLWSPEDLIKALKPQMTDRRYDRMVDVIAKRTYNFAPVLENIYDRGNVSAVMRSAEAFGFLNFHIVEQTGARFKAANRVTQGTDKWLKVQKHQTAEDCVSSLKKRGFQIYATHLDSSQSIEKVDFSKPTALVFGNEKDGVSKEMMELVDGAVILPMHGFAQSFNISVAAALCFFYVYGNRMETLGFSGDLNDHQKQSLLAEYLLKDK